VDENDRFLLETPDGQRVIRLDGLPFTWSLESTVYEERDRIDIPLARRGKGSVWSSQTGSPV